MITSGGDGAQILLSIYSLYLFIVVFLYWKTGGAASEKEWWDFTDLPMLTHLDPTSSICLRLWRIPSRKTCLN